VGSQNDALREAVRQEDGRKTELTAGEDWQAASVTWHPWQETGEDVWVHTEVIVRATGETLTIFLKGRHPLAVQGGATLFDDVSVRDLWP
jgi:hypothetical protein